MSDLKALGIGVGGIVIIVLFSLAALVGERRARNECFKINASATVEQKEKLCR